MPAGHRRAKPAAEPATAAPPHCRWALPLALVVATVLAYANSFSVPFLLDDERSVLVNPSIRNLADLGAILSPPAGGTTEGRPLLNLSFAINYAVGGESVRGYHVVNLLIHSGAALALFGFVRRLLQSTSIAFFAALLWTVHPLLTEAVTYVSQRAESLMGMLYLLALYAFARATDGSSGRSRAWLAASVLACAAGMAVKETMVTAPILILLCDRVFVAGAFSAALRQRAAYYVGLAGCWLLLAGLMAGATFQGRGVGATAEVSSLTYALTEFEVVIRYLGLALWPHPLVFDYGPGLYVKGFAEAVPWLAAVAVLLAATAWLWRRSPRAAFPACAFFLLLAPTSTVVPVTFQPMAESRMYLPLAAVVAGLAVAVHAAIGRRGAVLGSIAAAGLLVLTVQRNADYATEERIWQDNLAKHSGNWRAHYTLALLYAKMPDRMPDALRQFEATVRLHPAHAEARSNLAGILLTQPGRLTESIEQARAALQLDPQHAFAHANLGLALLRLPGRETEALGHLRESVRLKPDDAEARFTLANALAAQPSLLPESLQHYEAAVRLDPRSPDIRNGYAGALYQTGRPAEALRELQEALRIDPDHPDARSNLRRLQKQ